MRSIVCICVCIKMLPSIRIAYYVTENHNFVFLVTVSGRWTSRGIVMPHTLGIPLYWPSLQSQRMSPSDVCATILCRWKNVVMLHLSSWIWTMCVVSWACTFWGLCLDCGILTHCCVFRGCSCPVESRQTGIRKIEAGRFPSICPRPFLAFLQPVDSDVSSCLLVHWYRNCSMMYYSARASLLRSNDGVSRSWQFRF